ncbi:MAG TPA: translocation/assembly module TamB domain-containing protein [Nevskiaceae bacterium]|nr:translocation/assembly module TamB domain-containing protein [Nevskiaceae bacterium]
MRRLLPWLLRLPLYGGLLSLLALAWAVATPAGSRWTLSQLGAHLPGLSLGPVEGRLLDRLRLGPGQYRSAGLSLSWSRLELDWQALALLRRELWIEALRLDGLQLTLPPPGEAAAPAGPWRWPLAPPAGFSLRLDQVELGAATLTRAPGAPQTLPAVQLQGLHWQGAHLRLAEARTTLPEVGPLALSAALETSADTLRVVELRSRGLLDLTVRGEIQAERRLALEGRWAQLRWPLPDGRLLSPAGSFSLDGPLAELAVHAEAAVSPGGSLALGGRLRPLEATGPQGELEARWQRLRWPLEADQPAQIESAEGRLRLAGGLAGYQLTLDTALRTEVAGRSTPGELSLQASGDGDGLAVQRLEARLLGGRLDSAGQLRWRAPLSADLRGRWRDLDPGRLLEGWGGRLSGEYRVQGERPVGGEPQLGFELRLAPSRLRGWPLSAEARGRYRPGELSLSEAQLRSADSRLQLQGQLGEPLDLRLRLDSPELAQLWPGLSGALTGELAVGGARQRPRIEGQLRGQALAWQTLQLPQLRADWAIDLSGRTPLRLALQAPGLRQGEQVLDLALTASGPLAAHRLELALAHPEVSARFGLEGGWTAATGLWLGRLADSEVRTRDFSDWTLDGTAALRVTGAEQHLQTGCWRAPQGHFCFDARHRGAERLIDAGFTARELPLALLRQLLPPRRALDGELSGQGRLLLRQGRLSTAELEVRTGPLVVLSRRQPVLRLDPLEILGGERAGEAWVQARLPLAGVPGGLSLDARLGPAAEPLARPLSGQLSLSLPDLSPFQPLLGEVAALSGRIEGGYALGGVLGRPELSGTLALREGRVRLAEPGLDLQPVEVELSGTPEGPLRIEARARSEGELRLSGSADTSDGLQLTVSGQGFKALNTAEAQVWVDPELQIGYGAGLLRLRGELVVPRALIRPSGRDAGIAPSRDQVIVRRDGRLSSAEALPLDLELRLRLGEAVRVEGFGLTTRVEGALTASERPGTGTTARGELRLVDGRYQAYGQDLQIRSGRLLYNGGPIAEPGLDLQALRRPREDIEVGVSVRGSLAQPELSLTSVPAMPREQQLSWLVLGRPLEQAGSGDDRALVANAALSLGLSGTDYLAQNLRSGLGLDEISIGARPGEAASEAAFTVGKYLTPRLFVSYGVALFQPGQVFRLLYDLGRGFKLATESGVQAGGDLLYSVETGLPPAPQEPVR